MSTTPSGPFLLVQNTPNNPPGTSLLPLSAVGQSGVQAITLAAGNNNNLAIDADTLIVLLTPNAAGSVITGFARTGGNAGQLMCQVVTSGLNCSYASADANSLAANQILGPTTGNMELVTQQYAGWLFVYDLTNSRWRQIGKPDAA